MYCPRCGFRSDEDSTESCPSCGAGPRAQARPLRRPRGRTRTVRDAPRFSLGFKVTLAGIFGTVALAVLLPTLFPRTPGLPDSASIHPPSSSSEERAVRSGPATVDATLPSAPLSSPGNAPEDLPKLPPLDGSNVTPALLAQAKDLARERPDDLWLRQYVVSAHFWLARRRQDEHRFQDALDLLSEARDWGGSPGDVAFYEAFVYRDQRAWEPAERAARAALAEGSATDPGEMHHIVGLSLYARDDLGRAIEELETALALKDAPHIRASLERARRDARASEGFSNRRLSHFIVRYEGETMEGVGRMAMDELERHYASLTAELGFQPQEPIPVILYTRRAYSELSGDQRHLSGGQFDGKIRLPVRDVHWGDEYIRRTLHHELSHAFFRARTGGHDPRWLNEGLAEYVVGVRTIDVAPVLAPRLESDGVLEHCLLVSLYQCDVFYPASASVVDYVVQTRGMGGVRDVLSLLGEGRDIDAALERVLGRNEQSVIAEWSRFARRRR